MYNREIISLLTTVKALVGLTPTYTPFHYQGAVAGSEYLTYDAKKLYICFHCRAIYTAAVSGTIEQLTCYNQANAVFMSFTAATPSWSGAAINFVTKTEPWENFWFSRVAIANFNYYLINGIKITWP